jgi:hypothetical protein
MDRGGFLFIVSGLLLIVVLSLGIVFFLVPDSVPRGVFGLVTVSDSSGDSFYASGNCSLVGDNEPCDSVSLSEIVSLINQWARGGATLSDVVKLINRWASPVSTTTSTTSASSTTTTTTSTTTTFSTTTTTLTVTPRLSISLSTPTNNTNTTQRNLSFNYTVTGSNGTYNCSLFLNATLYNTSRRTLNNTLSKLNVTNLGFGTWWWNITCNINSTVSNTSQTRILTIRTTTTTSTTTTSGSTTTTTLPSNSSHPYLLFHNITETPGYQHSASTPWSTWEYYIISGADMALDWDFSSDDIGGYNRMGYRGDFAAYLGLAYQITKDTTYAAKAKQALLNLEKGDVEYSYDHSWALGGYSLTYDWVQPYLDSSSDIIIRDKLATLADTCYRDQNEGGTNLDYISFADYHGRSYPLIGVAAAALSDYTNPNHIALNSTPADWLKVATEYIFVNDELHRYNRSLLSFGFNEATGKNMAGAYKAYVMDNFALWYQVYRYHYGQNLMDQYPAAKKLTTSELWESLPNLYHNNLVTSGNTKELFCESFINLYDSETKSNALNYLDNINSYDILPYSTEVGGITTSLGYCTYQDYSSVPRSFPSYTSYLNRDGIYQVFRSDWGTDADWMSLVTYNVETNSNRDTAHHDQLSYEYYSRGDLLMADGGEIKYSPDPIYGEYETFHNTVAIENPRNPYSALAETNSAARAIYKGDATGLQTPVSFNNLIQTSWFEALDMGANITQLINTDWGDPLSLSSPIRYKRSVLFPEKEYFIVIDRLEGSESWIYRNVFRFTSLNIIPSDEALGNVKGNLFINNTSYNWLTLAYKTETATGITTNSIKWNTTNPYNDKVYLQLYSVPSSEIKVTKYMTRIAGYDGRSEVYAPLVYFRTSAQNNLYRATILLPRYSSEEEKIPSQIAVTGTGNALKVSSSSYQDYIYTGKGASTFANFSTDADTLYFRDASDREYTLLNGTYVNYAGSVLSLSQRADYFTLKEESGDFDCKIKTTVSTNVTIYNTGTITSVTMDGATHTSWHMSGSDVVITSPAGEHYFELS